MLPDHEKDMDDKYSNCSFVISNLGRPMQVCGNNCLLMDGMLYLYDFLLAFVADQSIAAIQLRYPASTLIAEIKDPGIDR